MRRLGRNLAGLVLNNTMEALRGRPAALKLKLETDNENALKVQAERSKNHKHKGDLMSQEEMNRLNTQCFTYINLHVPILLYYLREYNVIGLEYLITS